MLIFVYVLGIKYQMWLERLPLFEQIDVKLLDMVSKFQSFSAKLEIAFYCSTNWILFSRIFAFNFSARH